LLSIGNLDQWDLVVGAQSNNQLLVWLLLAGLVQDAHVCLTSVKSLGGFSETSSKTVVHEGELEDTLESVKDGHLALGGGICGDLNLLSNFGCVLFYVRLLFKSLLVHFVTNYEFYRYANLELHYIKLGVTGSNVENVRNFCK
jgi:hypothetical protein